MSTIRMLKNNYYYRLFIPRGNGQRPKENLINLCTSDKKIAERRMVIAEELKHQLIVGDKSGLPWVQNNSRNNAHSSLLADVVKRYLKARKGDGIRSGTVGIYRNSLGKFIRLVGGSTSIRDIRYGEIDKFKLAFIDKVSPHTLNMYLRSIKTFLHWAKDCELIEFVPKIKTVNTGRAQPIYVSNSEYEAITAQVDDHFKRAYYFYKETGCRLREPFNGTISGSFLNISSDRAKGHQERDIHLNDKLMDILVEMRRRVDNLVESGVANIRNAVNQYSRNFQLACKKAGIENRKLHSLRHSFAVRTYLKTRDIYRVAKSLGHSSVTTSEIYTKFNLKRLEQDFPDLAGKYLS